MNIDESKVIVFRKSGHLRPNLSLKYDRLILKLSQNLPIWELVFTIGGSLNTSQSTLSGLAQKAIFILNKYLAKFSNLVPKHVLDLFDKLISPILCYGFEVWGSSVAKDVRGTPKVLQKITSSLAVYANDFIYGETGKSPLQTKK